MHKTCHLTLPYPGTLHIAHMWRMSSFPPKEQHYFLQSAAESNFLIKPAVDGSPVITVGGDFLLEEGSGEYMRVQIYEGGLTHQIFLKSKPVNQTALNFTAALRLRFVSNL